VIPRPCCGSCFEHFVPIDREKGECHLRSVGLGTKVKLIVIETEAELRTGALRTEEVVWGRWPTIRPDTPGCPHHHEHEAWVERVKEERENDSHDPF